MEIYFFSKPYNEKEVVEKLEQLGFHKDKKHGGYSLGNFDFVVHLSDSERGRTQLQGFYLDDLWEKKKESKHYSTLEKLANIFHPERIVDPIVRDIFSEIAEKYSAEY